MQGSGRRPVDLAPRPAAKAAGHRGAGVATQLVLS